MIRALFVTIAGLILAGCTGFEGVTDTLNPNGPASLQPYNYDLGTLPRSNGQIGLFELSYSTALSDAQRIEKGELSPPTSNSDPISVRARRMAFEGVHLADSYCALFFAYGSDNQKWLLVTKDIVAALGTIATGAIALASPNNATAAGVVALSTAALYNGIDVYTRNFLFNSDNIDAVRSMTLNALAAHSAKALPDNDVSIWTFGGAVEVINEHQAICSPASIRSLVLAAIKSSTFVAATASSQTPVTAGSSGATAAAAAATAAAPAAAAAVVKAAPAAAAIAAPVANAAAATGGPAAAAEAARPGATVQSITVASQQAAAAGAQAACAALQKLHPGASIGTCHSIGNAAANVIAPAAAAGAVVAPGATPPTSPPPTRQLTLTPNRTP